MPTPGRHRISAINNDMSDDLGEQQLAMLPTDMLFQKGLGNESQDHEIKKYNRAKGQFLLSNTPPQMRKIG